MKFSILLMMVAFVAGACVTLAKAEDVTITIRPGTHGVGAKTKDYVVDDAATTVMELAKKYCEESGFKKCLEDLRVLSMEGNSYDMNKTLKDSFIEDGDTVLVKF